MMKTGEQLRKGISLLAVCLACAGAQAADWKFKAGVNVGETYSDNITLAPADSKQSDWVTEITPNISASKTGARFKANINYSMQNLFYARDSNRNQIYHQLSAGSNTELWENELFLDANASMQQVARSLLGARGVDNTNATGNNATQSVFSLSPYWVHRFGSNAILNARYTAAYVGYSESDVAKSLNTTTAVSLSSGSNFIQTPWSLKYFNQKLDYAVQPDVEFSTVSGSLGYLFTHSLMGTMVLGYERNDYVYTGTTKPEGRFWEAKIDWALSPRTQVEAGAGNHYYGNTKFLSLSRRGGHSDWKLDYSEGVATSNSQAEENGSAPLLASFGVKQNFDYNTTVVTNTVYKYKRFATAFNWKKARDQFNLLAYRTTVVSQAEGVDFFSSLPITGYQSFSGFATGRILGFNASWRHAFTPLVSGTLAVQGQNAHYSTGGGRDDKDGSVALSLERKLSPKMVGRIGVRHQSRQSDQDGQDYSENSVSGSVNYSF